LRDCHSGDAGLPLDLLNCFMIRGFFFTATATAGIYTLSLHDALPISRRGGAGTPSRRRACNTRRPRSRRRSSRASVASPECASRSEEHTSELQSRFDLVCRLLLEKKKIRKYGRSASVFSTTASSAAAC